VFSYTVGWPAVDNKSMLFWKFTPERSDSTWGKGHAHVLHLITTQCTLVLKQHIVPQKYEDFSFVNLKWNKILKEGIFFS
jgi:hypothetical protein